MARVVFLGSAEDDLTSIAFYVAGESGVDRAYTFVDRIERRCLALEGFPEIGRNRDDVLEGLRTVAFERRIVIAYFVRGDVVEIARIAYGGRDVEAILRSMT